VGFSVWIGKKGKKGEKAGVVLTKLARPSIKVLAKPIYFALFL
jgi:hypothetical protein